MQKFAERIFLTGLICIFFFSCTGNKEKLMSKRTSISSRTDTSKVSELDLSTKQWIDSQLNWVYGHSASEDIKSKSLEERIVFLQSIVDANFYSKDDVKELRALGIFFGDILKEKLDLHWIIIDDSFGKDVALEYKNTSIIFFPQTMISKRIEEGDQIELRRLVDIFGSFIKEGIE